MTNQPTIKLWKQHVSQWEKSGLSQSMYCKKNKITPSLFSKWKQKLQSSNSSEGASFVEVSTDINTTNDIVSTIKLTINDKYSIYITPGFDKTTLHELLNILEQ